MIKSGLDWLGNVFKNNEQIIWGQIYSAMVNKSAQKWWANLLRNDEQICSGMMSWCVKEWWANLLRNDELMCLGMMSKPAQEWWADVLRNDEQICSGMTSQFALAHCLSMHLVVFFKTWLWLTVSIWVWQSFAKTWLRNDKLFCYGSTQSAFYVNIYRTVIGPSG